MTNQTSRTVVVGVDGSENSDLAIRYAVAEARRRGTGITLVHAVHETAPMAAMLPLYSVEILAREGRLLVEDGERRVLELDPDLEVGSSVEAGSSVGVLVDAAKRAEVIVLGHRSRTLAGRVLTSSTTVGVAARAHCPTVSVPVTWTPHHQHGRVVVGLDDSEPAHDALAVAFAEARRRGAALTVLHAWRLPAMYDDIVAARVWVDDWRATAPEHMEKTLAPWREAYPDVALESSFRHDWPGPALLDASEQADLLVVGRRGHGAPLGFYLGSIARLLLREAHCPVMVAPHRGRRDLAPEDRLLSREEISPQA